MGMFHEMLKEVVRISRTRGMPVCVKVHPDTKHELEAEMRARASFSLAYTSKTAQDMVMNRLHEVDGKGRPVAGGWEIPIEADRNVPKGQFWVGVDGYEIDPGRVGRKIPKGFVQFPGRN